MNRNLWTGSVLLVGVVTLGVGSRLADRAAVQAAGPQAPRFEVDPFWPRPLPNKWILGQTIGVAVDAQDHVWIIHRAGSLEPGEVHATTNPPTAQCCAPAPPILEFDSAGNLVGHWGGPGTGYDWPDSNHGITVDYRGNVWIGGNGRGTPPAGRGRGPAAPVAGQNRQQDESQSQSGSSFNDNMVLKFTRDGKFLMQIGKPSSSKGSNDVANLRLPAKTFVDKDANELYVADGYGNHRVIVFDAETGQYKRHWGAYGAKPDDGDLGRYDPAAPPAKQFRNPSTAPTSERSTAVRLRPRERSPSGLQTRWHVRQGGLLQQADARLGLGLGHRVFPGSAAAVPVPRRRRKRQGPCDPARDARDPDQLWRGRTPAGSVLRRAQHRYRLERQRLHDRNLPRPAGAEDRLQRHGAGDEEDQGVVWPNRGAKCAGRAHGPFADRPPTRRPGRCCGTLRFRSRDTAPRPLTRWTGGSTS